MIDVNKNTGLAGTDSNKAYSAPKLEVFGEVAALTTSASTGTQSENTGGGTSNQTKVKT